MEKSNRSSMNPDQLAYLTRSALHRGEKEAAKVIASEIKKTQSKVAVK